MSFTSITPARYARYIPQRYRLEAGSCSKCGKWYFPPRLRCKCEKGGDCDITIKALPDHGELLTYTIIHTPSSQFTDQKPFAIGIIELAPGARITAQIADVDFDELEIGMKVRIEFRLIQSVGSSGVLGYGYKVIKV
jgi:hypothetical protein